MARLAILKPKFAPGDRLLKKDSLSFCLSWPSSGFGLAIDAEQPDGAATSAIGSLSSYSKSMKYSGSATSSEKYCPGGGRRLEMQIDVEGDEVVGPLLHPIVAVLDRREFDASCRRSSAW